MVQSLVVLDAVERLGIAPSACAGHSLGEYTALVASGAISFEDGIRMVIARGEAMNRAAEDAPGTMAAVLGLSDDDAEAACQRAEGDAWVANYNAPGQVVIAGTHEAVTTASKLAKEMGGRAGDADPGVRGLPHSAHGCRPSRPAQGARRRSLLGPRGAGRGQRRRAGPRRPGPVAEPALGAALQPGALAPVASRRSPGSGSPRSSSWGRAAS